MHDKIKHGIINEELFWWTHEQRIARRDEKAY